MRSSWGELGKHIFILGVLVFAFFPLYVTFAISVKNNKQFNNQPFAPLPLSGFLETFEWRPATLDAYDPQEVVLAQEAQAAGLQMGMPSGQKCASVQRTRGTGKIGRWLGTRWVPISSIRLWWR
jgi:ABC-type glycerol-3-phosphate transport system permease component